MSMHTRELFCKLGTIKYTHTDKFNLLFEIVSSLENLEDDIGDSIVDNDNYTNILVAISDLIGKL